MGLVRLNVANNAQSTLAESLTATATSMIVADATSFPEPPFRITADAEIIEVGAINRVTATFSNLLRAQEGTGAAVHAAGAPVENRFTAGTFGELAAAIDKARTYAP